MKIIERGGRIRLIAEDGMALRRKGDTAPSTVTRVALAPNDSPDNWEDCEYYDPTPDGEEEQE